MAGPATGQIVVMRARGELSTDMAAMRLLLLHRDLDRALEALGREDHDGHAARDIERVLRGNRETAATVLAIAFRADEVARTDGWDDAIARCGSFFDWAVTFSPEASVALYSFASAQALATATAEIVALLVRRGVVTPERTVLDVGCGIGRVVAALAGRVRAVTGVDVSAGMIAEARRRCPRADLRMTNGRDLPFPDRSFDAVLAVDSFPYVFQAGGLEFARAYLGEMARVLRPGGDIVILNLSYRGDPARDRDDAAELAQAHGLELRCAGAAELRSWDGRTFHFRSSR